MSDIATAMEEAPFPRVYEGTPELDDDGFQMWLRISPAQRIRIPHRFAIGIRKGQRVRVTIETVDEPAGGERR